MEENIFMNEIKYAVFTDKCIWLLRKYQYIFNVKLGSIKTKIKH